MTAKNEQLLRLVDIIAQLRAPGGCPWDRKQTLHTLTAHLMEEGFELIEAIEDKGDDKVCEEAGDLLMVVVMVCQVAADEGRFDLEKAARGIAEKLIRRHPHVFGDQQADNAEQVLETWEKIKKQERLEKQEDTSPLAGVPKGLPACLRALRMGEKASRVGFDWPDAPSAMQKIHEELGELEEVMATGTEANQERLFHEVGDLLFAVANVGRIVGANPEMALRATLDRFDKRFRRLEKDLGKPMAEASFAELDAGWEAAKKALRQAGEEAS